MALELKLNQKLSQSLVMTPQLQQAIKLLQLGRQEYLEVINQELLENPALEEASEEESRENHSKNDSKSKQEERLTKENLETTEQSNNNENSELLDYYSSYADSFEGSYSGSSSSFEDGVPSIEATIGNPEGLSSHLLWQLRTTELTDKDMDIAAIIVGNLDKNGYLECPIEEIAEQSARSVADVEVVLSVVQTLDPIGIAARDLRECLLIQLEQQGESNKLAWDIVSNHLKNLELRKVDVIAKDLGVNLEEVGEAVKVIQKLEPRPGRPFVDDVPVYITPDVYVKRVGDDYVVSLNENGIPRLKLNSYYQNLIAKGNNQAGGDKGYIQDRMRSAAWLIKSIDQRQQTIFRVTESIVKHQREFLEHGVSKLKPLVLRDIAEDVELHESTISRVTTNKYVHTPQGVFELKFFFTSGISTGEGQISSESVKERIRELIASENSKKPLSDQAIVNLLKEGGIDIARRTVAKYREMMGIMSSSRRKELF